MSGVLSRKGLGRWSVALPLVLAGAVAVPAAAAHADAPATITYSVDSTVRSSSTSAACGFDIFRHLTATVTVRLFRNQDGLVVREDDTSSDTVQTWYAPSTGKSFTYRPAGPSLWEYPGGAKPGSPAIATFAGLSAKVPGVQADAGQVVFTGTVAFIDGDGIPRVDLDDVDKITGTPPGSTPATRCAALR